MFNQPLSGKQKGGESEAMKPQRQTSQALRIRHLVPHILEEIGRDLSHDPATPDLP